MSSVTPRSSCASRAAARAPARPVAPARRRPPPPGSAAPAPQTRFSQRCDALDARRVPRAALVPRADEHQVARAPCPRRSARPARPGSDDVAARLAHALCRRRPGSGPGCAAAANGSSKSSDAHVAQRLDEEAEVHQVHHRVLGAARVLVDRQPVRRPSPRSNGRFVVVRASSSAGSTRTSRRRCPCVSVSRRGRPAADAGRSCCRNSACDCSGDSPVGANSTSSGSSTGSWSSGTGYGAVLVAVDDRDRRAPVALAADQPVAQAVGDGAPGRCPRSSSALGDGRRSPSVAGMPSNCAGVDHARPSCGVRPSSASPSGSSPARRDHVADRQVVLLRELEVALVVRRHAP